MRYLCWLIPLCLAVRPIETGLVVQRWRGLCEFKIGLNSLCSIWLWYNNVWSCDSMSVSQITSQPGSQTAMSMQPVSEWATQPVTELLNSANVWVSLPSSQRMSAWMSAYIQRMSQWVSQRMCELARLSANDWVS